MVPIKNLKGHQKLQLANQKPLLSLLHAVDYLLNNLCTNQAILREQHIYKVWSRECRDKRIKKPLKSQKNYIDLATPLQDLDLVMMYPE